MKLSKTKTDRALRTRAEKKLGAVEAAIRETIPPAEANRLLHELQVYQVELELQNNELCHSRHELEASRERYFELFDMAPVGYLTLNGQGKILEANLAVATLLGISRSALLNSPLSRYIFSEDQNILYLQRSKLTESAMPQQWEMRVVRPDGSFLWVELKATPMRNDECLVILADIGRVRKEAENALQESREKLKAYMDNSIDVIFVLDSEGVFQFVSRAWERHFGSSVKEVVENNFTQFVHPDDILPCAEYLSNILNDGQSKTSPPYRVKRTDGSWRWFIANGSRYLGTNNEWQFIGVAHDITEQNEAEEQLRNAKIAAEAANQAKSTFLATMSHEIRTPLSALMGNIELLSSSQLGPQQKEYLKDCQTASQMLLRVINDVLDFSKIEAGKFELINEIFSVSSMARAVMRIFAASAEQKGIKITLSLADNLPAYISGDQHRLRQIISNLLSNAIKFTSNGTVSLEIGCEQQSSCPSRDKVILSFLVRDTGKGIPPDKHASIFDSFTQVEEFSTRHHAGTGLGLAICRHLAELMGGSISLSSALGDGSAFTLSLPVVVSQPPRQPRAKHTNTDDVTPRNILLADDENLGRTVIAALLRRRGHHVTAVENGATLLEALQREKFDIVLSDISMPDMDGMEVARIIRSGEHAGIDIRVPIIAMTAHAFAQDQERFLASGINGYASKPVNYKELLLQIEDLCSRAV